MVSLPVLVAYRGVSYGIDLQVCMFATYSCKTSINLHLDDLSLYDLGLLLDAHANTPTESLCESLGFGHGQRVHLARRDHSEWDIRAKCLCHA